MVIGIWELFRNSGLVIGHLNMFDLIIIGAGPAGITAGIYAARQQLKTLLFTKQFGGQMARKAVDIENYPGFDRISGQHLIARFEQHLRKLPETGSRAIKIEMEEVVKIKKAGEVFLVLTESKKQFQSKAVLVASGADPRPLEVPGEKEFLGRGVSYCTVCDGPIFVGKTVAVIGGGNSGFEAAIFLSKSAKKVYILECGLSPAADAENQELAQKSGKIETITDAVLKEIKGKQFVEEIIYEKNENTSRFITLRADGVFVEIGSVPATSFVKGLVEFNQRDEIKIDPDTGTTITPGLFAAGDVTEVRVKQIVVAAGQGAKAALAAYDYLTN